MVFTRKPTTTDTEWQCGRRPSRPVGSSADAPSHPLCPLPPPPGSPSQKSHGQGVAALRGKGYRKRIHGKVSGTRGSASFPGPVSLQGDKSTWRRVVFPGLFCTTMETGPGWRSPRKSVLSDSTRPGNVGRSWPASAPAGEVGGVGGPQMLVCTMPDLSLALRGCTAQHTRSPFLFSQTRVFLEKKAF